MSKDIKQDEFNENWSRWEPDLSNLATNYYIANACYSYDGFKVILEEEGGNQKVEVLFYGISSVRITDEGRRLKLYESLISKYGLDFYRNWTFFKVEQSDYLQWLSAQSYEISDICKVKHFVLLGAESVLDVVTTCEPEVKILPSASTEKQKLGATK
jgi:hypothetical protein